MATVWATKMVSQFQSKPGAKDYWVWNNAPSDTVYTFSVQPYVLPLKPRPICGIRGQSYPVNAHKQRLLVIARTSVTQREVLA